MGAVLGFRDPVPNFYTTATPLTDSSTTGSASGSYPLANVQTAPLGKIYKRTGCNFSAGDVIIDEYVQGVGGWKLALAAALNVRLYAAGGSTPIDNVRVRCQISTSSFTSGYFFDQYRVVSPPPPFGSYNIDEPNAVFVVQPSPSETEKRLGGHASSSTAQYIRWTFDASSGYTNHDLVVGKIARFAGIYGAISNRIVVDALDESEVVRSFSGVPYVNVRKARKRVSAEFNALQAWQVYGGTGALSATEALATLPRVNQFQGKSYPVLFVPYADRGYPSSPPDPGSFQSPDTQMGNEHIYGLLESPLQVSKTNSTPNRDDLWSCPFSIQEITA